LSWNQALESLRSLVLFVIGLQTTDNEIQSKLVEVLSRCWTLFNQLVTNKPESITKEVSSDGSGSKFFDPSRVSHLRFRFWFGKFPLKIPNFPIFFPLDQKRTRVKDVLASIYCGSKVCSGQVRAHL